MSDEVVVLDQAGNVIEEARAEEEKPATNDADVTTQPSISNEEAAKTDVELSPSGDKVVEVGEEPFEVDKPADAVPGVPLPLPDDQVRAFVVDGDIQVRDLAKREIDMRLLPWNYQVETVLGPEEFRTGAFDGARPEDVYLFGANHEMRFGLGQDGRPVPVRIPVGRAMALHNRPDGPHATFKVARTAGGDEELGLAADRIVTGVSVEFKEVPGGTRIETRNGRRVRVHHRAQLTGASLTHRPTYGEQAAVLAVRSQEGGDAPMAESQMAPDGGANYKELPTALIDEALARFSAGFGKSQADILERLDRMEERGRMDISLPSGPEEDKPTPPKSQWAALVLKVLTGDRIPDAEFRALDDVITTDNAGVVPPAYLTELIGVIDNSRPFLATTRRIPTPDSGMQIIVPVINQRPTTAVQSAEKAEVDSTKTLIGTETFNAISIAGAGDLSIQILKRSSRNFLDLWLELLAEAYAIDAEDQALRALFNSIGGVGGATALDPEGLVLGPAFVASFDAIRRPPDTIWLSTEAVGAFIDAKATTTNQPLYPGLQAQATAAGGISGTISGLRAVHVPTLDAHGAFAVVGPSSGFAWAEDGTYTLQVDVPSKAGRDVGLIGMLWVMPWYPAAFTAYNVAS